MWLRYPDSQMTIDRWRSAFLFVLSLATALPLWAAESNDLLEVVEARDFRRPTSSPIISDGKVIFSQYAANGKNEEIVFIDPADNSSETLPTGALDARFVAADDRFVIYTSKGTVAQPLVVQSRSSGQRLATISLRSGVVWGQILGNQLLVIQGRTRDVTTGEFTTPALVLSLPDLQIIRQATIAVGVQFQRWKDKIVMVGDQLYLYDLELNQLAIARLPERDPNSPRGCTPGPLRIYEDLAIVGVNCGQIAVYDLTPLRLARVLPGFSSFLSFDVIDGVLFVTDSDISSKSGIRAYELATGRELARFPVITEFLAARNGRLVGIKPDGSLKPAAVTIYKPDIDRIRSGNAREAGVINACQADQSTGNQVRNIYVAIDQCEAAGIRSYLGAEGNSPAISNSVRNYGMWLAKSLSRYNEAPSILERLDRTQAIEDLLSLARSKARYLDARREDGGLTGPASAAVGTRETLRSEAPRPTLTDAASRGIRKQPLGFGVFPYVIRFADDFVYIARRNCGGNDGDVNLDVLDRRSLQLIKSIDVVPCDEQYEDSISSIRTLPGYVVLGLEHKYKDERDNIAVVDLRTREVIARSYINANVVSLAEFGERLIDCGIGTGGMPTRLDPTTATLVAASMEEAEACKAGTAVYGTGTGYDRNTNAKGRPFLSTPRYGVYETYESASFRSFRFSPLADGVSDIFFPPRRYIHAVGVPEKDQMVVSFNVESAMRFVRFDLGARIEEVLFEVVPTDAYVIPIAWRDYLLVAMGRDLLVYDTAKSLMVRVEKNLVEEGLQPVCSACADVNGIRNMLLDGDRLLVLTLFGENTRVIDLNVYSKSFSEADFFSEH